MHIYIFIHAYLHAYIYTIIDAKHTFTSPTFIRFVWRAPSRHNAGDCVCPPKVMSALQKSMV